MWLTKDGITVEVAHPTDIARYKRLGYIEEKIGYPNPVVTQDGKPVAPPEPPQAPAADPKPAKATGTKSKAADPKPAEKAVNDDA